MEPSEPYKYVIGLEDGENHFEAFVLGVGIECDDLSPEVAKELVRSWYQNHPERNHDQDDVLEDMGEVGTFFLVTTADDEDENRLDWLLEHSSVVFMHCIVGPEEEDDEDDFEGFERDARSLEKDARSFNKDARSLEKDG